MKRYTRINDIIFAIGCRFRSRFRSFVRVPVFLKDKKEQYLLESSTVLHKNKTVETPLSFRTHCMDTPIDPSLTYTSFDEIAK